MCALRQKCTIYNDMILHLPHVSPKLFHVNSLHFSNKDIDIGDIHKLYDGARMYRLYHRIRSRPYKYMLKYDDKFARLFRKVPKEIELYIGTFLE